MTSVETWMAYGFVMVVDLVIMAMEKLGGQGEQGLYWLNFRREKSHGQVCRKLWLGNDLMMRRWVRLMNKSYGIICILGDHGSITLLPASLHVQHLYCLYICIVLIIGGKKVFCWDKFWFAVSANFLHGQPTTNHHLYNFIADTTKIKYFNDPTIMIDWYCNQILHSSSYVVIKMACHVSNIISS